MDLDDLLIRYFGIANISPLDPARLATGLDRLKVDFGLERDRGRRFALWTLMHMLGVAPDLDIAFANETDRDAARSFMDLTDRVDER